MRVEAAVYVARRPAGTSTNGGARAMNTMTTWFVSVMVLLGLVVALHHLGLDVTASLGAAVRNTEHVLNRPLF